MIPAVHIEFEMIEEHINPTAIVKKKLHCFCLRMLAFFFSEPVYFKEKATCYERIGALKRLL